jgi:hypothetical protein
MHEDYNFDPNNKLDAEAAFNDYYIACRDIRFGEVCDGDVVESGEKGS